MNNTMYQKGGNPNSPQYTGVIQNVHDDYSPFTKGENNNDSLNLGTDADLKNKTNQQNNIKESTKQNQTS